MKLTNFNPSKVQKIAKINSMLNEQFGIAVPQKPMARTKLEKLRENAEMALIKIRGTRKQFQLDADYAKFLGIRDVIDEMISEGMYAESPKYFEMKEMIESSVRELMDSGYTTEEACKECMNRYRMDNRFAYDDEHILPLIQAAAESYMAEMSAPMIDDGEIPLGTDEMGMGEGSCMECGGAGMMEDGSECYGCMGLGESVNESAINEEVDVEQAEVVMAVRALADDIQSQIERIGRMMNEDIPAISDQMRSEMGATQAQSFSDSSQQLLSQHLEATKSVKAGLDQTVTSLTGGEVAGGLGDTAGFDEPGLGGEMDDGMGLDDMDMDDEIDNIQATTGPADAPLGRAEI